MEKKAMMIMQIWKQLEIERKKNFSIFARHHHYFALNDWMRRIQSPEDLMEFDLRVERTVVY